MTGAPSAGRVPPFRPGRTPEPDRPPAQTRSPGRRGASCRKSPPGRCSCRRRDRARGPFRPGSRNHRLRGGRASRGTEGTTRSRPRLPNRQAGSRAGPQSCWRPRGVETSPQLESIPSLGEGASHLKLYHLLPAASTGKSRAARRARAPATPQDAFLPTARRSRRRHVAARRSIRRGAKGSNGPRAGKCSRWPPPARRSGPARPARPRARGSG